MEISFSTVWNNLINFVKNPRINPLSDALLERPGKVFLYLFGIDFILMFFLSALLGIIGVEGMEHKIEDLLDDPLLLAGLAVLIAPIMEEVVFRLPIGAWWGKYFKPVFWLMTLAFALVHLSNFGAAIPIYLAPILVLPQFLLGIIIGYVRTGWGFWYGVLFHALHNGILVGLATLGMALGAT